MNRINTTWAGVAAMAGGCAAVLMTPLMSMGYYRAYALQSEAPPFWLAAAAPLADRVFAGGDPKIIYANFGRVFAFVYLLMFAGVWGLRRFDPARSSRFGTIAYGSLLLALIVSFVGTTLDYWNVGPGWTLELLGMLSLLISCTICGAYLLRSGIVPEPVAVWLLLSFPLGILSFMLIRQIPSAPTLPFAVASIAIGAVLIRNGSTASSGGT